MGGWEGAGVGSGRGASVGCVWLMGVLGGCVGVRRSGVWGGARVVCRQAVSLRG